MKLRSTTTWIVLILLVALAVRVAFVLGTPSYRPVFDGGDYVRLAVALAHGHGYANSTFVPGPTALRPPLYPAFLAAIFVVTGDSITAARLVQAVVGVLTVALVGVIAWQLWGKRVALVAASIAAVLPSLVLTSGTMMSESLYIPLVAGAIAAALQSRKSTHTIRWALLAGGLSGLGLLTRPNGIALLIAVAILVPFGFRGVGLRGLKASAAVLIAAVVLVVPWTIRNAVTFHALVPISDSTGFNVGGVFNATSEHEPEPYTGAFMLPNQVPKYRVLLNEHLNEYQLSEKIQSDGISYALGHPGYVLKDLVIKTWRLSGLDSAWNTFSGNSIGVGGTADSLWSLSWILLAIGGLASLGSRTLRRAPVALWVAPVLFWLTAIPISGEARFRTPIEIFVVMVAAVGVTTVWERLVRPAPRPLAVSSA